MTQRRNDLDAISNYFDSVLRGIGHRGSSFTDVDALTHDGATGRILVQEFKRASESLTEGQRRALQGLASVAPKQLQVWYVQQLPDGNLKWAQFGSGRYAEVISLDEYREKFRRWWAKQNEWIA